MMHSIPFTISAVTVVVFHSGGGTDSCCGCGVVLLSSVSRRVFTNYRPSNAFPPMRKGHFHFHLTVPLANEVRMEGSATMSYICREVQTDLRQASRRHPIYLLIKPSPPPLPHSEVGSEFSIARRWFLTFNSLFQLRKAPIGWHGTC